MSKPRVKLSGTDYGLLLRLEWDEPASTTVGRTRRIFPAIAEILCWGPGAIRDWQSACPAAGHGAAGRGAVALRRHAARGCAHSGWSRSGVPHPHRTCHVRGLTPRSCTPSSMSNSVRVRSGEKVAAEGHLIVVGDVQSLGRRSSPAITFSSGVLSGVQHTPVCLTVRRRSLPPCILLPSNSVLPGILPDRQRRDPMPLGRQSWRVSTRTPLWSRRGSGGVGDFTKGDRPWLDESLR